MLNLFWEALTKQTDLNIVLFSKFVYLQYSNIYKNASFQKTKQ